MSDAETRALGRAALLLLAASLVRWGWGAVGHEGSLPAAPNRLPELLRESRAATADQHARARPLGDGERIDPNRAPAAELDRLPGIGPATARAIVASRDGEGPFQGPEDLARVKGVGEVTVERIRGRLDFTRVPVAQVPAPVPARPQRPVPLRRIDVNHADEAALRTLPGIGPALARRILAARAERPFTSLQDLARVRGIGPATVARLAGLVSVGR